MNTFRVSGAAGSILNERVALVGWVWTAFRGRRPDMGRSGLLQLGLFLLMPRGPPGGGAERLIVS